MTLRTKSVNHLIEDFSKNDAEFREAFEKDRERAKVAIALLELREQEGLSQQQLADRVGKPQSMIARIESGRANVTMATIIDIAYALGKKAEVKFV
ncbi:MAG: helix-turn-helix transcriptional regulator [Streptococcaceae bacterium]|jgi:ribosome-binding protein aMBF1 (putative translation factor)|nr:helix-turn-helix transcriptional regulator [Streptococcaceae bacterium]